jgi:hypothetical protein
MADQVTITYAGDSAEIEVAGKLTLNADQLLEFIRGLGRVREQIIAGKPIPPLEGQQIGAIFNTRWYIQAEMMNECSALSFYHPGFGALGFLVPIEQVQEMVRLLTIHLNLKEQEASKTRN